ncbi:hypothetical protein [Bradyrhizobium sp. SZCCHNS3004]|uniref:SLOG domain-containing protein n=1 Tax=Bradyrhizobium sp. SZCCHNS3004 TaxID=3057312 RepID=UPI0029161838|nr:hypothetical protein [Bradyrhizobium sp. SZCCHNS3004]
MTGAVFLSASVPDPRRAPNYAQTADAVAITAAVGALAYVTLGRRKLVWGGHPAITPMIAAIAESMDVDYGKWAIVYQSEFFKDEFPEDNARFQNVVFTKPDKDLDTSLLYMRQRMFSEHPFDSGIFIGGMKGILHEFALLSQLQPKAELYPIFSTGGATLDLMKQAKFPSELIDELDYIALFHRLLKISPKENRYREPKDQPASPARRLGSKRPPRRRP